MTEKNAVRKRSVCSEVNKSHQTRALESVCFCSAVHSEKDIKSLGLEEKLSEVSAERYGNYKKAVYKSESTSTKFWIGRSFLIEVVGLLLLIFSIHLMEKELITTDRDELSRILHKKKNMEMNKIVENA